MTKVAAPVVKMVEPILELIDFEEEIKVEKISKNEVFSPEIFLDKLNSKEEIHILKNNTANISQNEKNRRKNNINKIISDSSSSNDSNISEYIDRSLSCSDLSEFKTAVPRRNPCRKTFSKEKEYITNEVEPQNGDILNKSSPKKFTKYDKDTLFSNAVVHLKKLNIKKINSQKNIDLPLSNKDTVYQNNTEMTIKHNEQISESLKILNHVPTIDNKNIIPLTPEADVNINKAKECQQVRELSNIEMNIVDFQSKRESSELKTEIDSNQNNLQIITNNSIKFEDKKEIEDVKEYDKKFNEDLDINKSKNLDVKLDTDFKQDSNTSEAKSMVTSISETLKNEGQKTLEEMKIVNENNNLEVAKELIETNKISSKHNLTCEKEVNIISKADNLSCSKQEIFSKPLNLNEGPHRLTSDINLNIHIIDLNSKIEIVKNDNNISESEINNNNSLCKENSLLKFEIEKNESTLSEFPDSDLKNISSQGEQYKKDRKSDYENRFFLFDDNVKDENSICHINFNNEVNDTLNTKICGEIIYKAQQNFAINCYICWDDEKWTFKKFSNVKLFLMHLNSHSIGEILSQNEREGSYSLDFVNVNSCVMPKPMWFGIYSEMIFFKCGFVKVNSEGYILYSCRECGHIFKKFNTFTEHILNRENQNKELKNSTNIDESHGPDSKGETNQDQNLNDKTKTTKEQCNVDKKTEILSNTNDQETTNAADNSNSHSINDCAKSLNINSKENQIQQTITDNINENKLQSVADVQVKLNNVSDENNLESPTKKNLNEEILHIATDDKESEQKTDDKEMNDKINNINENDSKVINKLMCNDINEKHEELKMNDDNFENNSLKSSSDKTELDKIVDTKPDNENEADHNLKIFDGKNNSVSTNNKNSTQIICISNEQAMEKINDTEDNNSNKILLLASNSDRKDSKQEIEDDLNQNNSNNVVDNLIKNNIDLYSKDEIKVEETNEPSNIKNGDLETSVNDIKVSNEDIKHNPEEIFPEKTARDEKVSISNNSVEKNSLLIDEQPQNINSNEKNILDEDKPKSEDYKEANPDTYGYRKITSAILNVFENDIDDPISSKLDKILSIGKEYREIKEKNKLDLEAKEQEKLKLLNLSIEKDRRPKLEGLNILTKNILNYDEKLALLACKCCNRRYTCLTNLREHFRVHVGDRINLCNICQRGFSKKSNLEEHVKLFHKDNIDQNVDLEALSNTRKDIAKKTNISINENNPKEKGFKCCYCARFLSNRNALEDHFRLHFGEKPLKCEECNLQFLRKSIYDNHLIELHGPDDTTNLETIVNDSYDKENNMPHSKSGRSKSKLESKSKFKCKNCPRIFSFKMALRDHIILEHNDGEFKCRYCEQRFDTTYKRIYHEKFHETNSKYTCTICYKLFSSSLLLEMHEKTHNLNNLFKCKFCEHYFATESAKQMHEGMHAGIDENRLKIQTVDIATILQMNNEQAPISSNGNTNDSNGTSSDTGDRSTNQNTTSRNLMVKKIIKKIKRGKRDPNSPLDCRYCKKHFESPHQLSYHERLHEIGKKFQCNICDKILASSYALQLHVTSHMNKDKKRKRNNKFNGSTILANQLTLPKIDQDNKPRIEVLSDISLAPTQTIDILSKFFKRDKLALTVTTTSKEQSFLKIGIDDIEKNLTAHVLRDTDPFYQLMADFSYQYQLYQMQNETETNAQKSHINQPSLTVENKKQLINTTEQTKVSRKGRKKKIDILKPVSTIESDQSKLLNYNTQKNEVITESNNLQKNNSQELSQNIKLPALNENSSKDTATRRKDKKKITPEPVKNLTSAYIKCEYCNQKFNISAKKALSRHRRLHFAGDSHKCNFCNKSFMSMYYLDRHLKLHHINNITKVKCRTCDATYALKEVLRRHEIRTHKEVKSNISIENINEIDINLKETNLTNSTIGNDNKTTNSNTEQEFIVPDVPKSKRKPRNYDIKLFDCDFCIKSFATLQTLQRHVDCVHKKNVVDFEMNYKFNCTYENCKKKFENRTNLDKHLRLHQSGFKCSMCSKKTLSQFLLDIHMKIHGLPTAFGCQYCKSKFTMKLSKDLHERKMHLKGAIQLHPILLIKKLRMTKRKISYSCFNCKKSFSSLIILKAHTMYKHPVFECNICPAIFTKINELEEHEKIHLKTLQCNLCDKTFENKHTLYKHRRQHETKFFKCNMCPAEFSFRDELNEHKKNHDESERPFKCVELGCDKAFVVETFLNTHLKKIHGYFLFNCDRCKREFLNEDLLIKHKKDHELLPSDKQYRCNQCFKDFSTMTILKIHQKLHQSSVVAAAADAQTPDPQKTSKLKLYTCEQCDKRFSIVTYLNNHLKKVHQVKLFVCEHCKMEFRNAKDLQEHSKVHLTGKKFIRVEKTHLDRPFKCELCGNSYAILAYLNNHLNKAHGNEEISNENGSKTKNENNIANHYEENNKSLEFNQINLKSNKENDDFISNDNSQNEKKNNSIKCDHCYLRFVNQKFLTEHAKMHLDPNNVSRIELLESAFNPQRSEKIINPVINSIRSNNNSNQQQQKEKPKKQVVPKIQKRRTKKQIKPKIKRYDEDSHSSVELIDVSEPPIIPEHNLSYTQITEALSSASSRLTAIQPVEVIENPDDDEQMTTTELTPLTTLTSLTSLTPLTPLAPTSVFHHSRNESSIHQNQQPQTHMPRTPLEITPLEPSTISEATKLSLTLLEPSALSELTAFTEPSTISAHSTNLTDISSVYNDPTDILHHEHTVLTELTSSSISKPFETQLVTTQCNNSSTMLNTSSASSDYAVTNLDTSQITQHLKKPRISDSNIHLESFTMLDDNSSHIDHKSQSEMTNFSSYGGTHTFLSSKVSDHNISFADLASKSIMSDSTSLEPLTYSDSMPLSESTTILELTSSSHPTSSSEAFSESNNQTSLTLNSSGKKKRNGGCKNSPKPRNNEILNLEGDFDTCNENNNFKCVLCKKIYDCWVKFRKHNEYHVARPYQCAICPCNFKTTEELFTHNKGHENTENSFPCEICNRVFVSKSRLKAHTLTVHNEERLFKCDYCASAFKTKSRLVDHVRSHTGEKPIKCHYCDEHFSRAAYRLKHARAVHPELLEIDLKHREDKLKEKKNSTNEK